MHDGLDQMLSPIDKLLEAEEMKGVQFEDNLSSHKTDSVLQFWTSSLPHFTAPRFFRPT